MIEANPQLRIKKDNEDGLRAQLDVMRTSPGEPFVFLGHRFVMSSHFEKPKPKQPFRAQMRGVK